MRASGSRDWVTNAFFTYPAGTEEDDGVFYRKDGTGCGTSGDKFHHHAVTLDEPPQPRPFLRSCRPEKEV